MTAVANALGIACPHLLVGCRCGQGALDSSIGGK